MPKRRKILKLEIFKTGSRIRYEYNASKSKKDLRILHDIIKEVVRDIKAQVPGYPDVSNNDYR